MPLKSFVENPLRVAEALGRGELGASYREPALLISGLLSSLAAFVWPGENIDRKRFTEAWVRFAPQHVKISVPLLRRTLRTSNRVPEAVTIEKTTPDMFGAGYSARVLLADDVDSDEAELQKISPTVEAPLLRAHSYPVVFYEQVRCELVHEYEMGEHAVDFPQTIKESAGISYANYSKLLPETDRPRRLEDWPPLARTRRIYFPIGWLAQLVRTIAANADRELAQGPIAQPAAWWAPSVKRSKPQPPAPSPASNGVP